VRITIKLAREDDGRWIAHAPSVGILVYGSSRREAVDRAKECCFEVLSGRVRAGEEPSTSISFVIVSPQAAGHETL
jgi:predicted RNase H-like HicB family nuclease